MSKTNEQKILTKFNQITGLLLRGSNEQNTHRISVLLSSMSEDDILNHAEDWLTANPNPNGDTAMVKFYAYAMAKSRAKENPVSTAWKNGKRILEAKATEVEKETPPIPEAKTEQTEVKPAASSVESQMGGFMTGMIELVGNEIVRTKADEISKIVEDKAVSRVQQFIHDNYGELPKKTIVEVDKVERTVEGITHEKFEDVLKMVKLGISPFLVGGAGSGKNVLCEQIAQALNLPFKFTNAITQEYQLMGFTDAYGNYHPTPFYEAWTQGCVFMLDELDASNPEVVNKLNACLSGDTADFPAPIGNVKRHPDFHCIAAGNTYGLGADYEYVGRNVLDAASLNRFCVVPIGYSPTIEEAMAKGDNALLKFCRSFRETCRKNGIRAIVSYRNIKAMADLSTCIDKTDVLEYCLTASMKYDDLNIIQKGMKDYSEWGSALADVVARKEKALA